jgi:hypothetical protein
MRDDRNNVEQVLITDPAETDYCISVVGERIHVPKQGYALVVTGAVEWATSYGDDCPASGL